MVYMDDLYRFLKVRHQWHREGWAWTGFHPIPSGIAMNVMLRDL